MIINNKFVYKIFYYFIYSRHNFSVSYKFKNFLTSVNFCRNYCVLINNIKILRFTEVKKLVNKNIEQPKIISSSSLATA